MSEALISDCGKYRYWLTRHFLNMGPPVKTIVFVMLNPSTADAEADDPTIRRCKGFATAWGYTSLLVINLYAYRATKPSELWQVADPVGELNDGFIKSVFQNDDNKAFICAWGANAKPDRVNVFVKIASQMSIDLQCLDVTKNGAPKHPLYIPGSTLPMQWNP
ncbi:DUF1643 domain-containing protein [Candidatus Pacearchaeota archaeon]|nr:DUF1643 domain-containing protein [Candidatus Pacearchaeota archaeon]